MSTPCNIESSPTQGSLPYHLFGRLKRRPLFWQSDQQPQSHLCQAIVDLTLTAGPSGEQQEAESPLPPTAPQRSYFYRTRLQVFASWPTTVGSDAPNINVRAALEQLQQRVTSCIPAATVSKLFSAPFQPVGSRHRWRLTPRLKAIVCPRRCVGKECVKLEARRRASNLFSGRRHHSE
jgi:hypothetical protein